MKKVILILILFIIGILIGYYIAEGNIKHVVSDTVKTFKTVQSYFINDDQKLVATDDKSADNNSEDETSKDDTQVNKTGESGKSSEGETKATTNTSSDTKNTQEIKQATEKSKLRVYYGDKMAVGVVGYEYTVDNTNAKDIQYVFELLKNAPNEDLVTMIPKTAKLISGRIENGTCILNLTEAFISDNHSGSAGELITLDSIVNTYTELDGVNRVQFLIEGEKREVFLNSIFDKPFVRNESSIISK